MMPTEETIDGEQSSFSLSGDYSLPDWRFYAYRMSVISENLLKHLSSEIKKECSRNGLELADGFIKHCIELLVLIPTYGKHVFSELTVDSLDKCVKAIADFFLNTPDSLNTLMIQYCFITEYRAPAEVIAMRNETIQNKLNPLLNEILNADPEKHKNMEDLYKLLRKVSMYIILMSGLADPANILNLRDGFEALKSIYTAKDLEKFMTLSTPDKKYVLNDLYMVVSGIRLFYKDCQRGNQYIVDVSDKLDKIYRVIIREVVEFIEVILKTIYMLTSAAEDKIGIDSQTKNIVVSMDESISALTSDEFTTIVKHTISLRQLEIIVRIFITRIYEFSETAKICIDTNRAVLNELHEMLKAKTAVSIGDVYPKFAFLWHTYRRAQSDLFTLCQYEGIIKKLKNLKSEMKLSDTLRKKLAPYCNDKVSTKCLTTSVISLGWFNSIEDYKTPKKNTSKLTQKFFGFCAISLGLGVLIPCNPKISSLYRKEKYMFSHYQYKLLFDEDPERYVKEIVKSVRKYPELIYLLNTYDLLYEYRSQEYLTKDFIPAKLKCDSGNQTCTHPVDSYIDPEYSWNLWQHKKNACHWASIVKSVTHSSQTNHSHFRSEIPTQTGQHREKEVQTRRDNTTNVPKPINYIWGLRDDVYTRQHVMSMTSPINEWCFNQNGLLKFHLSKKCDIECKGQESCHITDKLSFL